MPYGQNYQSIERIVWRNSLLRVDKHQDWSALILNFPDTLWLNISFKFKWNLDIVVPNDATIFLYLLESFVAFTNIRI